MKTRSWPSAVSTIFVLALFSSVSASAQIGLGADLYSRYIWRGSDFGDSFSIQPALSYTYSAVEVGAWSSYSISADGSGADELDLYVSVAAGPLSFGVTDYHFPNGSELFNFDSEGKGAHYVEPFVSYSGVIDLYAGAFVYNDPATSIYIEAAKTFDVDGASLTFTVGGTPTGSDDEPSIYGTTSAGLLVIGVSASRDLPITTEFSLPLSVSYVINPYDERSFLFFGVSI